MAGRTLPDVEWEFFNKASSSQSLPANKTLLDMKRAYFISVVGEQNKLEDLRSLEWRWLGSLTGVTSQNYTDRWRQAVIGAGITPSNHLFTNQFLYYSLMSPGGTTPTSFKSGKITSPTSTGNQAYTGLGFQPKAVIFYGTYQTSETTSSDATTFFGVATSTTNRASIAEYAQNNNTNSDDGRRYNSAACITVVDSSSTTWTPRTTLEADLVSFDADGFTLNWSTVQASSYNVYYLALGGSNLTNATVLNITEKTTTGTQAYTGAGFQPDAIMLFGNGDAAVSPSSAATLFYSLGFGTSSTNRATIGLRSNNSGTPTTNNAESKQDSTHIFGLPSGSATMTNQADLSSLDADGFTLNWGTSSGSARNLFALCLKGGNFKVGTLSSPTSTGNQSYTGIGFKPKALFFASWCIASSSSNANNMNLALGSATSSSARGATYMGDVRNVTPTTSGSNNDSTKAIKLFTPSATPTLVAAADLVTMDSDGFTLNWTSADATAREVIYFAIA